VTDKGRTDKVSIGVTALTRRAGGYFIWNPTQCKLFSLFTTQ